MCPASSQSISADEKFALQETVKKSLNSNTPVEIIMKLADDKNWNVREGAAANPNAPAEVLMKLAEDENLGVKYTVAANPNAHAEALRKLVEDIDVDVRKKLLSIPIRRQNCLKNWQMIKMSM